VFRKTRLVQSLGGPFALGRKQASKKKGKATKRGQGKNSIEGKGHPCGRRAVVVCWEKTRAWEEGNQNKVDAGKKKKDQKSVAQKGKKKAGIFQKMGGSIKIKTDIIAKKEKIPRTDGRNPGAWKKTPTEKRVSRGGAKKRRNQSAETKRPIIGKIGAKQKICFQRKRGG